MKKVRFVTTNFFIFILQKHVMKFHFDLFIFLGLKVHFFWKENLRQTCLNQPTCCKPTLPNMLSDFSRVQLQSVTKLLARSVLPSLPMLIIKNTNNIT